MKKSIIKSFGIILSIFFAFACVLVSGCGNKYKKMGFEVQYAFSLDSEHWYDVDDEISLIMGEGREHIKKDDFGVGTLYVRVNVSGVKAKHIGDIIVSKVANGGPSFSSVSVKEGEIFPIQIHETEKIVNSLKIYETKSKRSKVVGLNVYQELTEIAADLNNNPAVMVGGTIDLKKYNNLKFLSNGREGLVGSAQEQIEYAILGVGSYDNAGEFKSLANLPGLSLIDGVLSVNNSYGLGATSYIVKIQAKSLVNDIAGEFDVYIVDRPSNTFNFVMKYEETDKVVESKFTLYPGSDEYGKAPIVVDTAGISALYMSGMNSSNGTAKYKYEPVVYVDGVRCDNGVSSDNGLGYEVNQSGTKYTYTFSAFPTGKYTGYNVEIKMEIKGLDFSHSGALVYSDKTTIEKKVLPNEIRLNNNENYISDIVYIQDDKYDAKTFTLNTFPVLNENSVNYPITITTDAAVQVKYAGKIVNLAKNGVIESIAPGTTITIVLDSSETGANVTFSVKNVPDTFAGVEVAESSYTKEFTLTGKVTAKQTKVYADAECTKPINTSDQPLLIDANGQTNFYVKVWAKNILSFDPSTVELSSNDLLTFNGGEAVVSLVGKLYGAEDTSSNTAVYKVAVNGGGVYGKIDTAYVNIAGYGVGYTFITKAVNTVSDADSIVVKTSNSYIQDITGDNLYFALEHGQTAQLVVEGKIDGLKKNSSGAIEIVEIIANEDYNSGAFSKNAVSFENYINPIEVESRISGKTSALTITAYYYVKSEDNLTMESKTIDIQIATYTPITNVKMGIKKGEKDEIIYINQFFENAAKTIIEFDADFDNDNPVTEVLNFDNFSTENIEVDPSISKTNENEDKDKTVTGLKIYSNVLGVYYYINKGGVENDLTGIVGDSEENAKHIYIDGKNLLKGSLGVKLKNDEITENEIVITLVATRFGVEESVAGKITIKVNKHDDSMTDIRLIGSQIKNEGNESTYVYANAGQQIEFITQAINTKNNKYSDLAYKFSKIEKDDAGNIRYNDGVASILDDEIGDSLVVDGSIDDNIAYRGLPLDGNVKITANDGGLYLMEIYALDSYDGAKFKNTVKLFVNVSDGTEQNPYIIRNATDFASVASDKHYVLGRDFENTNQSENLIDLGEVVEIESFAGSIKGIVDYLKSDLTKNKSVRYTLKYTSNVTDGYATLIKSAGATAKFENFDIVTNYNININDDSSLNIAGLVAVNEGTISNVGLTINSSTIASKGKLNFGGLVVDNSGTIDLADSNILIKYLEINNVANSSNIGMVAATNSGNIKADYSGIESFDSLNFDIMANVIVDSDNDVNVGGVVGSMTDGTITNVLVGGCIVSYAGGNLAGIVASGEGTINTVATFALDLTGVGSSLVAGIAATSSGLTIENVRVESAEVEFTSLGISSYGKISGAGEVVAGIVANSNDNDTIKYAAVESFIDTIGSSTYYMLENTNTIGAVYGLSKGGASVQLSFVDANIAGDNITLTSGITETNTYFIGNINKDFAELLSTNATYAVLYNDVEYKEFKTTFDATSPWSTTGGYNSIHIDARYEIKEIADGTEFNALKDDLYTTTDGINFSKVDAAATFDTEEDYYIYINSVDESYPYLLKDGKPFMIIRPTGLNANIVESKIEEIGSVYISESASGVVINKVDLEYTTDDIDEIAIINYFNDSKNPLNNEMLNTYEILDLISPTIIPPEATGGIMFKIVSGASFARIDNNTNIVFLGVSSKTPIIVKCYSVINPSLTRYVVFYTEYGYTDIKLTGSNIESEVGDGDEVEYNITINTAPTSSAERIEIEAENLKDDFYNNIFDANNRTSGVYDFIQIDVKNEGENKDLISLNAVSPANLTTFTLTHAKYKVFWNGTDSKPDPIANAKYYSDTRGTLIAYEEMEAGKVYYTDNTFAENSADVNVEFEVKLNLTKYFGESVFPKQGGNDQYYTLKTLKLKVEVVKTATNLVITNKPNKIETNSSLSFNTIIETGYFGESPESIVDYEFENNTVLLNEEYKDSLYFTITPESGYEDRVLKLLKQAGLIAGSETECINIPKLFDDFKIKYTTETRDGKPIGYNYSIATSLVEEYNYRYITEDIKFKVNVYSKFDENINDSFVLTIKPASLSSTEIKNYNISKLETGGSDGIYTMFEIEKADSYIISPGNRGGIIVINMEPSYANLVWDKVMLTSTPLYVPELGREVYLSFEQVVYNRATNKYETAPYNDYLYDSNSELKKIQVENGDEKGIKLFPFSEVNEGKSSYTGKIYIYVTLEYFVGYKGEIVAKLFAPTLEYDKTTGEYNEILKENKIHLLTQYLPGVSVSYDGNKIGDGYLVQENTPSNVMDVKLFGYQFATMPNIGVKWINGTKDYYPKAIDEDEFEELKDSDTLFALVDGEYKEQTSSSTYNSEAKYFIKESVNNYVTTRPDKNIVRNVDGSVSMKIYFRVEDEMPAGFIITIGLELTLEDGQTRIESNAELNFYPTDYILTSVELEDVVTIVNTNNKLNLHFNTENSTMDYNDIIYDRLINDMANGVDYSRILQAFSYNYKGNKVTFDDVANDTNGEYPEFDVKFLNYTDFENKVRKYLTIQTKGVFNSQVEFALNYGYVDEDGNGTYRLVFGNDAYTSKPIFNLRIDSSTSEENAIPIDSAEKFIEFMTNGAGQDFILTNDIVLENYTPIATEIASLDGNNRIIKIKSFAVSSDASANYGLFSSFGTCRVAEELRQSILKNVVVDYSQVENIASVSTTTEIVFGGIVAKNNGGLIYNCDVINLSYQEKTINILFDGNNIQRKVIFGGLVGINGNSSSGQDAGATAAYIGTITNSRVGRKDFLQISVDAFGNVSERKLTSNKIKFVVGNSQNNNTNGFIGLAGAFVGQNNGKISSSYVINTSLISYSTSQANSKTAGFVAENGGTISYSYVQADPSTISTDNPYSTGAQIESVTNGRVAGFVFSNNGEIDNSYSNTVLVSHSNFMAGFAFENSNIIRECYSACKLNALGGSDTSEQPFIGSDDGVTTLSSGSIENSYYYKDSKNFDTTKVPTKIGKNQATGLSLTNFRDSEMLHGFVFVLADSMTESEQGVWSYYTQDKKYRLLPELTSTNIIATSYRYLTDDSNDEYKYTNAIGFEQGSKANPYIIRSVAEYNQVMTANNLRNKAKGYIRFISDIDFTGKDISTHANGFVLGDPTNRSMTSIEGNGMTLSGIYLDAPDRNMESIGMFAEIQNAYIKNLNLKFDTAIYSDNFSSISVKYSGGLAGKINNSVIINITLDGSETTLAGSNAVGGLAGIVTGSSLIYGIESNLSVVATEHDFKENYYLYGGTADISNMCYAGGLAGIIDITSRANERYNISYIDIRGDEMSSSKTANISGDYVGGVAGYAGSGTSSFKLKYHTGTTDRIAGGYVAGGLYGFSMGAITASQVTAIEGENEDQSGTQYAYDTEFGSYIIGLKDGSTSSFDANSVGNLNLISSTYYAGGLIGIGVNTEINSSYSKASFKSAQVVGGLIGVSVSSKIMYSYAVTYVNVDLDSISRSEENDTDGLALQKVGGLIGVALAHNDEERKLYSNVSAPKIWFEKYNDIATKRTKESENVYYNDIQYTFSTLLVDYTLLESNIYGDKFEFNDSNTDGTDDDGSYIMFDYISPDFESGETSTLKNMTNVFAGLVNYNSRYLSHIKSLGINASSSVGVSKVDLYTLYDVNYAQHGIIFDNIFSMWPTNYWTLNPNRYFPLLLDQEPLDRIEIRTASDIQKIVANPSGDFIVKNNIDMSEYPGDIDDSIVKKEFTGSIVGDVENLKYTPTIYNITIETSSGDKNVGFFASSTDAIFRDVNFSYSDEGIKLSIDGTKIGGLVAVDKNSTITGVKVGSTSGINSSGEWEPLNDKGMLKVDTTNSVKTFGGIVGDATNTTIVGCEFASNLTIGLNIGLNDATANFGGLVGIATYADNTDDFETIEGFTKIPTMTVSNSTTKDTTFSITASSNATIGGAIGSMDSAVLNLLEVNNKFTVNANGNLVNFGGLAGTVTDNFGKLDISSNDVKGSTLDFTSGNLDLEANVAGLVGHYGNTKDTSVFKTTNTDMEITFTLGTIKTLRVAQGIAEISGTAELKNCLFAGSIEQGDCATITNIHTAGAVAYSSSDTLKLQEIMTTTNIELGSGSTDSFVSGGLIGEAKVANIKYCVSTGRIVPTTSNYGENTSILIGGLAGLIKSGDYSDVMNSYSTTSIITGGLGNDVMQGLETSVPENLVEAENMKKIVQVNALFGVSKFENDDVSNVFYSTDVALNPEDSKLGTNLSAYKFYYDSTNKVVYKGVISGEAEGFWSQTSSNTGGTLLSELPYLNSLTSTLVEYNILKENGSHYSYDMEYTNQVGSALKPIIIDSQNYNFNNEDIKKDDDEQYCYFLISPTLAELAFEGSLSGILIGAENEYNVDLANLSAYDGDNIYGVVPHVSTGSAVSNLHINLGKDTNITLVDDITGIGFAVGKNEGTVFNCSTQGIGINISDNSTQIGMITHTNEGTVSHSFSSVEVLRGTGPQISGITFIQGGKLISNYFTGYFGEDVSAAGIIYSLATVGSSYTYNNYSAGVIKSLVAGGNSFSAQAFSEDHTGSNNYIDQWANLEFIETEVVQSIDTVNLMTGSIATNGHLAGNWTTIIDGKITETDGAKNFTVNTAQNSGFGRNYGYPIYDMNKFNDEDGDGNNDANLDSLDYYLNTGTGENKIDGESGWYKMPHLGVFSIVDGISGANRNYLFIYDIDAGNKDWSKHAVGRTNNFTGTLSSNKNFALKDGDPAQDGIQFVLDDANVICNLAGSGLLTNIDASSTIEFIKFGSMSSLTNSGAIGQTVVGETTINSISFVEMTDSTPSSPSEIAGAGKTVIGAESESVVGALFGTISGNVIVNAWTFAEENNFPKISNATKAGLIAGEMTAGTLTLNKTIYDEESDEAHYFVRFNNCQMAGGLIGEISGGSIVKGDSENNARITIYNSTGNDALGGLVGKASGGEIDNIDFIRPKIDRENVIREYTAYSFGGLVSEVAGDVEFNGCGIELQALDLPGSTDPEYNIKLDESRKIIVNSPPSESADGNGYGFIAGKISSGNLDISGFEIRNDSGEKISAKLCVIGSSSKPAQNIGGIAGLYTSSGSSLTIDEDSTTYLTTDYDSDGETFTPALILHGQYVENIGGMFGSVSGILDASKFELLTEGSPFASIQAISGKNMGGLVGKVSGGTISGLVNANSIVIPSFTSEGSATASTFENIGGVFGHVENATLCNIQNNASVGYAEYGEAENHLNVVVKEGTTIQMFNINNGMIPQGSTDRIYSVRTMNVGGIAGYASNVDIRNKVEIKNESDEIETTITGVLSNTNNIQGYQNVGGIFGYATGINDTVLDDMLGDTVTGQVKQSGDYIYFTKSVDGKFSILLDNMVTVDDDNKITTLNCYRLEASKLQNHNTMITEGQVVGVLNVGGAFGCVENSDTDGVNEIYGVQVKNCKVHGNVNVGGFAGYAPSGEYNFNKLEGTDAATPIEIKGLYYAITTNYAVDSETGYVKNKSTYYIPTSIGGFIGKNIVNDSSERATVGSTAYGNTISGVNITTTEEGWPSLQHGYDQLVDAPSTISTISNKVLNSQATTTLDGTGSDVDFWDEMKTGIGGFIGTTNSNSLGANVSTNTLSSVTINASLGINVGAYYGYCYQSKDIEGSFSTPTASGSVNVSGAYVIGGVVGFYDLATGLELYDLDYSGENGTITVQGGTTTGMYVGGLIGRLNGSASNITLTSGVSIDTNGDYYIGGLFGRLEGSLESDSDAGVWTKTKVEGLTVVGNDADNFGGLVGMLKVNTSDEVKVQGAHNFWFTVNTVENSNYKDGETILAANDRPEGIYITALAYYVNNDQVAIAGSSMSEPGGDWNTTNGPWGSSIGWAPEYTMFRILQRNIPNQKALINNEISNTITWDSIAVLYDANAIREVYTRDIAVGDKLGNGTTLSEDNKYKYNYEYDDNDKLIIKNYIDYTIYEDMEGSPTMYTSFGIATPAVNGEGKPSTFDGNRTPKNGYYRDGTKVDNIGDFYRCSYTTEKTYKNIVTSFKWEQDYINSIVRKYTDSEFLESGDKFCSRVCTDKYYAVKPQYKIDGENDTWFVFDRLFGHKTLPNNETWVYGSDKGREHSYFDISWEKTEDQIVKHASNDGCLFSVSASLPKFKVETNHDSRSWFARNWWILLIIVAVIVIAVIVCYFCPPLAAFFAKIGAFLAKFGALIAKHALVLKLVKITIGIALIFIVRLVGHLFTGLQVAKDTYLVNKEWQSYGFISQSYTRKLRYNNDRTMQYNNTDSVIFDGDLIYYYYSDVRPADYYSSKYFSFNTLLNPEEMIIIYSENQIDQNNKTVTINNNGTFETKSFDEVGGLFDYYVYKNGSYYITAFAGTYSYVPSQDVDSSLKKYIDYVENDHAIKFVRGSLNASGTYTLNDTNAGYTSSKKTNTMTALEYDIANSKYKVNGVEWSEVVSKFNGHGLGDQPTYQPELKYQYQKPDELTDEDEYDGYTKITKNVKYELGDPKVKGAEGKYKSMKLTKVSSDNYTATNDDTYKSYSYHVYEPDSDGEYDNSNYLLNGETGEYEKDPNTDHETCGQHYTRVRKYHKYTYAGLSEEEPRGSGSNGDAEIYIEVRAIEFTTETSGRWVSTNETWYLHEVYVTNGDIGRAKGLTHSPTFYWYEKFSASANAAPEITNLKNIYREYNSETDKLTKISLYTEEGDPKTITYEAYFADGEDGYEKYKEYYTSDMQVYKLRNFYKLDNDNNLISFSFKDVNNNSLYDENKDIITESKVITGDETLTLYYWNSEESKWMQTTGSIGLNKDNYQKYKDYYVDNPESYKAYISYIKGTDASSKLGALGLDPKNMKIDKYYIKSTDQDEDDNATFIINGITAKVSTKIPTASKYWYYNKYLINSTCKIYTRYKYSDGKGEILSQFRNRSPFTDRTSNEEYYIISDIGNRNPNEKTTYLIESVNITISGNHVFLLNTDEVDQTAESYGYIQISKPE